MILTQIKTEPNQQRTVAAGNDPSKIPQQRQQFVANQQKFAVFQKQNEQVYSQWDFWFFFNKFL